MALAGGGIVLIALLVGESDNAFADIYSAAVSTQNVANDVSPRLLAAVVGALGFLLALAFTAERYEQFLFLIGSVFVPLAAVFVADYFVRSRGRYGEAVVFGPSGVRWLGFVPWAAGFVVYHWCVPTGPRDGSTRSAGCSTALGCPSRCSTRAWGRASRASPSPSA